jgi:hypothetical protein
MKKFSIMLLAAALSLPALFAASQAESTTPAPAGQAQADTAKATKKAHKASKKRHHSRKQKAAKSAAATTGSTTEAPASK